MKKPNKIDYSCEDCGLYIDKEEHTMFSGFCEQCAEAEADFLI